MTQSNGNVAIADTFIKGRKYPTSALSVIIRKAILKFGAKPTDPTLLFFTRVRIRNKEYDHEHGDIS